ncbi:hypothetical protein HQ560_01870 [bacterium]|nr:hypothetical protein [bacterium]
MPVDSFHIDIVRGDLLVEIQTAGVSALRYKLVTLARHHRVRLVLPVTAQKWIVRVGDDGQTPISRRKSPKHGRLEDVFAELMRIPHVLGHVNFTVEALLIHEEEVRRHEPGRAWRRKGWVTHERRLLDVAARHRLDTLTDLRALLPASLPEPFTTADLAAALGAPRRLAQQMAYCLRETGAIASADKRGNAILYERG